MPYGSIYTAISEGPDYKPQSSLSERAQSEAPIALRQQSEAPSPTTSTTSKPHTHQLPTSAVELLDGDSFLIQSELMTHIGAILSDCLGSGQCGEVKSAACHALMEMVIRPDQKKNFIRYTAAFGSGERSPKTSEDLIEDWWSFAAPSQTPAPFGWFDTTKALGPQFICVAICAMTMIRVSGRE